MGYRSDATSRASTLVLSSDWIKLQELLSDYDTLVPDGPVDDFTKTVGKCRPGLTCWTLDMGRNLGNLQAAGFVDKQ